jgi:molecular chaperone GrpE
MTKKFTDKIKSKKPETKKVKTKKKTEKEAPKELSEAEVLTKERDELKDRLLRTTAELQNNIRRNQEQIEKAHKFAITSFAKDLVNTMENLFSALDNLPKEEVEKNEKFKNFADGVALTYNELKKAFDKNNIKRIFPINEQFNPDFHQAIVQIPSDKEEGTVIQVMQAGYTINERLLRPALVGVAKKK